MSINYSGIDGLGDYLATLGYVVSSNGQGVFTVVDEFNNSSDAIDATVQALIDNYDPIDHAQKLKTTELKVEGLERIQEVFPAIVDIDQLKFYVEFWLSILPQARSATTDMQKAIDIYTATTNAVIVINAETDWQVVKSYDVKTEPSWPI